MEMIKHFSHKHRLTLYYQNRKKRDEHTCSGCGMRISSAFYGCKQCFHYICKSCAELPLEMQHPFHREHPLTLLATKSDGPCCNACSNRCHKCFFFHCSECKFDLDVNCATLMPTTKEEEDEQQITHPHPLILCDNKKKDDVDFRCSACQLPIKEDTIYVCLHCRAILDESCAQLPQQITHHFHSHHSLTLKTCSVDSYFNCKACGDYNGFRYSCSECAAFDLDVRCASLMPKAIINYDDQSLESHQLVVQPFTHQHVLIPCDTNGHFSFSCSACGVSIEGTVYVCLECRFSLHKACAELPKKITHPFNSQHPLVLVDDVEGFTCKACIRYVRGFKYRCTVGSHFEMDIICASLRNTVKFQLHQHPLAFFNMENMNLFKYKFRRNCAVCSRPDVDFPYFCCVPCNFNLHLLCVPTLPHTFKHSNHRHSLTLTCSSIKDHSDDDDDSEYYCDLCEERRNLPESTYYCEECHYVAEVSCVFNEILPLLEREWSEEEIVMLQAEVDALIAKLKTLTTKLGELKERREQHFTNCQIGVMEVETKNASTDQKAFLSGARDHPAIVKTNEEIIMLEAEVDAPTVKLMTVTTKFDEFKKRRAQHIHDYQTGVTEAETRNALTDQKTFLSAASDHSPIAKPDEEIVMLQAEVVALTAEFETLTTKLDELKERYPQNVGGYQIGIPSRGTNSSVTILDDSDEVVEEDCSVESTDKEDEDEESDGAFSTLSDLDAEIEAIAAKLEVLKKKRARRVSHLELK